MQKQPLIWNAEPAVEIPIRQDRSASFNLPSGEARARQRRIRIALPTLPRRQSCVTKRAMLAALREAELAEWQASGGDCLAHLRQAMD